MRLCLVLTSLGVLGATAAAAQRPTGVIGAYVPPKVWQEEPRRFDLLHQTMRIRFDAPRHELWGSVTTRVAITTATDYGAARRRPPDDHGATDAKGRKLQLSGRYDARHGPAAASAPPGRHRAISPWPTLGVPQRGLYFVPRSHVVWTQGEAIETRAWIPTYDAPTTRRPGNSRSPPTPGWRCCPTARSPSHPRPGREAAGVALGPGSPVVHLHVLGGHRPVHRAARPVARHSGRLLDGDPTTPPWRTFGETPSMIEIYSQVLGVQLSRGRSTASRSFPTSPTAAWRTSRRQRRPTSP